MDKAKVAVEARELFKKWVATLSDEDIDKILGVPAKSRRQEKVRELAEYFMANCGVPNRPSVFAEAALEWVRAQLPEVNLRYGNPAQQDGYETALADVRRNLGLDQ